MAAWNWVQVLLLAVGVSIVAADWKESSARTDLSARLPPRRLETPETNRLPNPEKPLLFLHVGPPKTGTTTLQSLFGQYRSALAHDGIYYFGGNGLIRNLIIQCREQQRVDRLHPLPLPSQCQSKYQAVVQGLQQHWQQNHTVLLSDELFLKHLLVKRNDQGKLFQFFRYLSRNWTIVGLFSYRRYHEREISAYSQRFAHDPQFPRRPMLNDWPGIHSGVVIPSLADYLDSRWIEEDRDQYMVGLYQAWKEYADDWRVFNMQSDNLGRDFLVTVLPEATTVLQQLSEEPVSKNSASSKEPMDVDRLAVALYQQGWIDPHLSRAQVVEKLLDELWNTTNNTTIELLPYECLTDNQIDRLAAVSLDWEEWVLPNWTPQESVWDSLVQYQETGKLCSLNVTAVVSEDNGEWKAWAQSLTGPSKLPLAVYWIPGAATPPSLWQEQFQTLQEYKQSLSFTQVLTKTTSRIKEMLTNGTLVLPKGVQLVDRLSEGAPNQYSYDQLASLTAHLETIHMAYAAGQDYILILEGDTIFQVSGDGLEQWESWVQSAPGDWNLLQRDEGRYNDAFTQEDAWVSWQPDHSSSHQAYLINRQGMRNLLGQFRMASAGINQGNAKWVLTRPNPLLANQAVPYYSGHVYSSTTAGFLSREALSQEFPMKRMDRVLVMAALSVSRVPDMIPAMIAIRREVETLRSLHEQCDWIVHILLAYPELHYEVNQAAHLVAGIVEIQVHDLTSPDWKEWSWMQLPVNRDMADYDNVLFRDHGHSLTGFPWSTFLDRTESALVAAPLHQSVEESLSPNETTFSERFPVYNAREWSNSTLCPSCTTAQEKVEAVALPMVGKGLVLMDAAFAGWFFTQLQSNKHDVTIQSYDTMQRIWCGAANEFDPTRASCVVVPVVSMTESASLATTEPNNEDGAMPRTPQFRKWWKASSTWVSIVQYATMDEVARECKLRNPSVQFNLEFCGQSTVQEIDAQAVNNLETMENEDQGPND